MEASTLNAQPASLPAVMYLESQRGCPYDCIMCTVPGSYGRIPSEMPDGIIESLRPYFPYVEVLAIHGNGEALLSKKIDQYVDIARDNDCFLHCNTTAFPLNNRLSDKLLEAKLDLRFSIHAGTERSYRRIMDNNLATVLRGIAYLLGQSALHSRHENTFWFSFIVMKENVDEIEPFLRLAHGAGIRKVRFMRLLPNHRTILGTRRSPEEARFLHHDQLDAWVLKRFNERLPDIKAMAAELGIEIGPGNMEHWVTAQGAFPDLANRVSTKLFNRNLFPLTEVSGRCLAPWTGQVQIEQNGDVGLCCAVRHVIGNLLEDDFSDIWRNHRMAELRRTFNRGTQPKVCGYCRGVDTDEYDIPVNRMIDRLRTERREATDLKHPLNSNDGAHLREDTLFEPHVPEATHERS